jgi:ATP adenylyltransferase
MGDFAALWQCLAEKEALVFYNAGKIAGASQSHKHLQLIALPIANANPQLPIQRLLEALSGDGSPRIVAGLPWVHRALRWPFEPSADPFAKAEFSFRQYRTMLADVGLNGTLEPETCPQAGPYNLLATREWMILIPRSSELFDSISINALGFAGTFFLKDEEQLRKLREAGPMAALRSVGVPWSADALSKSIR